MPATLLSPTQAVSAHAFVQSIGVNTHVGYERAWGYGNNAYDNMNMVKSALNWVNIDHVRDRFDYDHVMPRIDELASMGIRFCVNMGTGPGVSYSAEIARIAARANVVEYVEGPNEVDRYPATFNGQTGYAAAVAEMKKLYADIHASTALNGNGNSTLVLNLTFADWRNWTNVGNLSAYVDFGSAHIYPASGEPPLRWLQQGLDQQNLSTPGERMIITEGGYSTLPQAYNMGSVSEAVHAKYTIEYLLDAFRLGVERTYLYELLDERPDPGGYDREAHFGLFRYDGSAKPAATAIRNMMTLLADQATGAAPATLNYKLTGQPWDTQSMLFQKSDGTFLIALWNEVNVWNANTSTHSPAASVNVVLDLPVTYGATQVYDPLLGTGSIRSLGGVGNAIVALPDHPIFIEVRGGYPAPTGIVLDDADALTGTLGAQRWGEARISGLDWTGKAALVTREASGLGVAGGRNATQIDRNSNGISEVLRLDFDKDYGAATIRAGRMMLNENNQGPELGWWKAFDAAGKVVGEGVLDPRAGIAAGPLAFEFRIDPTPDFRRLEFTARPYLNGTPSGSVDSSDFSIQRISLDPAGAGARSLAASAAAEPGKALLQGADATHPAAVLTTEGVDNPALVVMEAAPGGVTMLRLDAPRGTVPLAEIVDGDGGDYHVEGFVAVAATLGAGADRLEVTGAARGEIVMGAGADTVMAFAAADPAAAGVLRIAGGAGADDILVEGGADATRVWITGGAGADEIAVAGVAHARINAGGGADHIVLGGARGEATIVLVARGAAGDLIEGLTEADHLLLSGYGAGGTLTALGDGRFVATSADGQVSDVFTVTGIADGRMPDYAFA